MYKRLRSKQDNSQSVAGHDWLMSPIHQQEGIALSSLLLSRGKKEIEFCKPPDTTEKNQTKKNHGGVYIPFRTNVLAEKNRPCSPPPHTSGFILNSFIFLHKLASSHRSQPKTKKQNVVKNQTGQKGGGPGSPGLCVSVINATVKCESNGTASFPQEGEGVKKKSTQKNREETMFEG